MKQIITGPMGRVVYHNGSEANGGQYPALNVPCRAFARADVLIAANAIYAPITIQPKDAIGQNVIQLPRKMRSRAALAMFGVPAKREN
jgi:hypothetical protein